ncbi:MAG: ChbG/HpnK family deacetylase [Lachnospiraceae bacterium]|nr:ChbG/HpnK family deacetylase [Candidatus Colinaster equi]
MRKQMIDYHADDYGLSVTNSRIMIDCIKNKRLDSISIIPTMDCYEECKKMLLSEWDSFDSKPLITVHIDLIDGNALSGEEHVLIKDDNGYNISSWGGLFIASCIPGKKRDRLKKELREEILAQMEAVYVGLPDECELRLDSHMHTHMIPVVRDAMFEAVDSFSEKYNVKPAFVRVAREPITPFLSKPKLYLTYSPINFVKNVILNILSPGMERRLRERGIDYGLLWGLIMSGHMDLDRCTVLLDDMTKYANKRGRSMEILYHPGRILTDEVTKAHCKEDVTDFYVSENRDVELEAVNKLER